MDLLRNRLPLTALTLAMALTAPLAAQRVGPLHQPAAPTTKSAADRAPRIVEIFGVAPLAVLPPVEVAEPARLHDLRAWNEGHHQPFKNGLVRALPHPVSVELSAGLLAHGLAAWSGGLLAPTSFDRLAWGAAVKVESGYRLRLHLSQFNLPKGSRLWVHSGGEEKGPFSLELRDPQGGLWTPSVGGDTIALDVEMPVASLGPHDHPGFVLDQVVEILPKNADTGPCDTDLSCAPAGQFPGIDSAKHGVASISFVEQGQAYICSAGLLNDAAQDQIPYLLTANHCISDSSGAASIEAFWDYYTTSCGGQPPDLNSVPTSSGARLLATGDASTASDYTLLRLTSVPPGRTFLGWDGAPDQVPDGTLLFRLSSPDQEPLDYCVTQTNLEVPDCAGPRTQFLYSSYVLGGTFGGSSGAPAMLAEGEGVVVGQLYGGCGNPNDCSPQQYTIDGSFSATFQHIATFIAYPPSSGPCKPSNTTLCLVGNRFMVTVAWFNQFNNTRGVGTAVPQTDESGFFTFTDPSNYELVMKMLNFGDTFKFFYGELTDLVFTITVTDTANGHVKTYTRTLGDCGGIDENAFPTDAKSALFANAEPAGTCRPSSDTLCLLKRRLAVTVTWQNEYNNTAGAGSAVSLSDETGRFSFTAPSNVELVLKALYFGDTIRFFYGAMSDFGYVITVTDTITGEIKTYTNPPGNYCGGIDNNAF
jgi:hypothetical protein